ARGAHRRLCTGVDECVDPAAVELCRKEQAVAPRSAGGDRDIRLGPGRRRAGAGLLAVESYPVVRQVEIDIEAAQTVGSKHAVEWSGKQARHADRGDANPSPRYRHAANGEAAQLHLARLQAAGNPAHLPLNLDA